MTEQNNVEEYTDEATGIRLTVERDIPEQPRLTVFAPENNTLSIEDLNAAVARLLQQIKPLPKENELDENGLITEGPYAGYTPHDAMVAEQQSSNLRACQVASLVRLHARNKQHQDKKTITAARRSKHNIQPKSIDSPISKRLY